jgi:hypothetical protein
MPPGAPWEPNRHYHHQNDGLVKTCIPRTNLKDWHSGKRATLSSNPSTIIKKTKNWALVAHAYNPSYSGGRDQEDLGLKPAQAKFRSPYLEKNPLQKRAGGVVRGVGPEFKPQYSKKKKEKSKNKTLRP